MNNQSSDSENSRQDDPLSPSRALAGEALARRRLLLKGATGGASALAALTPAGALATGGTSTVLTCIGIGGKPGLCSVSGVNSAAHSFGPNITRIPASGGNPTYWKNRSTWPTGMSPACQKNSYVANLLSGCSSTFYSKNMMWALQNYPTSNEAIWICAYLNGATMYSASGPTASMSFPYSSAQVKAFWDAGSTKRSNALALFKAIMTRSS
jgi:hypothetical protein